MSERPSWWDGVTHDALYTFENIGREVVTTLCGKRVHVTELYGLSDLTCPACKVERLRERLRIARGVRPNLLSVGIP
jgi:hypothetical protein